MSAGREPDAGALASMEPSPHQLRMFLVLSEELHFGRAATRLFITQAALSQQLRALERRLGVRLIERDRRTTGLTPAGQALLPQMRTAVEAMSQLRRSAQAQLRQCAGELVVGAIAAEMATPHTRAVLDALRRECPGISVRVVGLDFAEHMTALGRQDADVVFLRPPVPEGIETLHLATEPRVACLSADDPLAALPRLTLDQLAGHPVVDMPPGVPRAWWDFWAVDPRPDGSPVRYGPVVTDMESLLHTIAQGQAMCFLPAAARDLFPRPGVRYVEVAGLPPCTAAMAWLAANRAQPTIAAIRRVARASYARA
ncbi:LysR family transcriptional regulator [Streptomyces sp. B1866]|uniref:LysR family transcriptional regulator n=1 Tax=Streptomyces sp. B1866 TaxID=3075431 RepID=UPI00288FFDFF|nr:LysR family transcriptional regulator [Streptomyces sp. B1866]MDT3398598.1 LysR family transcriptional regulator [Streptomyces sp. B1866]